MSALAPPKPTVKRATPSESTQVIDAMILAFSADPALRERLADIADWQPESLHELVKSVANELDLKLGKVAQPLRVAIVGRAASPGIDITLYLVGREASLRRIDLALDYIRMRGQGGEQ